MASSVTEETPVADSSNTLAPVGEEQYVKHPLHNEWSWWFFKNDKGHDWKDNLKFITTFGSVEDFWAVYNHIQPVSSLPTGCDYSLFKKGIEPMWEDTANRKGGRWLLQTEKKQRPMLDHYWMEMLLLLVGETLGDDADEVCGIVVQVRTKADKLAIWTRNAQNKDVILRIGQKFKEVLNLPHNVLVGYQSHQDTSTKTGSTTKNMYSVWPAENALRPFLSLFIVHTHMLALTVGLCFSLSLINLFLMYMVDCTLSAEVSSCSFGAMMLVYIRPSTPQELSHYFDHIEA